MGETRERQRCLQEEEAGGEERPHLDDVEELVPVDAAVSVHVVELEVPAQLVLHLSPHHQAERGHVLHEVDVAVLQKPGSPLRPDAHLSCCAAKKESRSRMQDYLQARSENRQLSLPQSIV